MRLQMTVLLVDDDMNLRIASALRWSRPCLACKLFGQTQLLPMFHRSYDCQRPDMYRVQVDLVERDYTVI